MSGLLELALESLNNYNAGRDKGKATRISEIICSAGLLACFEANTLKACFELYAEGTAAEGATLTINTLPLKCSCDVCGEKFELLERKFVCPACGADGATFSGGSEFIIQAINVAGEENDNDRTSQNNAREMQGVSTL